MQQLTHDSFRHEDHRPRFSSQRFSRLQLDRRNMRFFAIDLCSDLKINEPVGRETIAVVVFAVDDGRTIGGGNAAAAKRVLERKVPQVSARQKLTMDEHMPTTNELKEQPP